MADFKESSGFCVHCRKRVVGRKQEASHLFWLIATLFSCGLFGIVWLISMWAKAGEPFKCSFCGTPLQPLAATGASLGTGGAFGAAAGQTKNSPHPVLIVGGVIFGLALMGVMIITVGKTVGGRREAAAPSSQSPSPVNALPISKSPAIKQPQQSSEQQAQARRRWAQQYEIRKRGDGFANAKCTVGGKNNTTLSMRSEAVVIEGAIQTLSDSGYFDEVFDQGFTKLILMDPVGHTITLTR